jgi:hypothetical protein
VPCSVKRNARHRLQLVDRNVSARYGFQLGGFAEQGTKQQLVAALRAIEDAKQTRDEHAALAADLATTGGHLAA